MGVKRTELCSVASFLVTSSAALHFHIIRPWFRFRNGKGGYGVVRGLAMGDQWECLGDAFKLGGDGAESGADVGLPAVGRYRSHLIRSSAESGSDAQLCPVIIKRPAKLVSLIEGG
jgi:hypothetical protein